ncbi:hypothetical protein GV828_00915 [Flavobacterium sp. NST-5]|uniref:Uncharacterized protein n=1 Tax=Flavobacterium ichthyis TaxID=2698827 RepID=A0ABW9Z7D8_9FLAO|nr:hypothetical protein [Flavobacterium ichthyis]NBL63754.1 hypothetical protein [Flavobacterium ichthyis]
MVKDNHEHGEKVIAKNVDFSSFQKKVASKKSNLQFEKIDVLKNDASKQRESVGLIHTIFTNEIFYMEMENGMITYTLKASTNLENDQAITNIVYFSQNGNDFDYKVIRYFPSDNWLESYRNNPNTLFSGTIEGFNSTQVELSGVTYAKGGSMQCPIAQIPVWICAANNAHSFDDYVSGLCRVGENRIVAYNTVWGDCPNSGGGEGSGGGNPGNNENPGQDIIEIPTKPVVFQSFFQTFYDNSLNFDQQKYLNDHPDVKAEIENFVDAQGAITGVVSEEVSEYMQEILNHGLSSNLEEVNQEIIYMLNILEDGLVNGQAVVDAPNVPIVNMHNYLNCFDTSEPATITLYADQPTTGSHSIYGDDTVGHAFISIKQGTKIKTLGFYPQCSTCSILPNPNTMDPRDFISVAGVFGNDENHAYDVSVTTTINAIQLSNLIGFMNNIALSNPQYNLGSMNCTDLAILIFESQTNIDIPSCESPSPWKGQTPGTLGEILRNLSLPINVTRNTNGGTAPTNSDI